MRIYSAKQEGILFLSPYVRISFEKEKVTFYQTVFNSWVSIPCSEEKISAILTYLDKGIEEKELKSLLCSIVGNQDVADGYLTLLQQAGVIE